MACEFSVESFRMEIFRVFDGLAKDCISTPCEHIENRSEKDGVLIVEKRRLFPRKRRVSSAKTKSFEAKDFVFFAKRWRFLSMELDFVIRKTVFRSKTSSKQEENSADLPVLHSCFVVRKMGILYFGFC